MTMTSARKFHRDASEIPTDPVERRALIKWLFRHRLWQHEATGRRPPEGREDERFRPVPGRPFSEMVFDGPDWVDEPFLSGSFNECVDVDFVYVNPVNETIEDEGDKNTAFRVWIEAGGWADQSKDAEYVPKGGWTRYNKWMRCHDTRLDCGGPEAETALLELAVRVKFFYGDGHEGLVGAPSECRSIPKVPEPEGAEDYASGHTEGDDGYCTKCGFWCRDDE